MIQLENIKRVRERISCDAYPDDCKISVRMEVSISTGDVTWSELPKGYEY